MRQRVEFYKVFLWKTFVMVKLCCQMIHDISGTHLLSSGWHTAQWDNNTIFIFPTRLLKLARQFFTGHSVYHLKLFVFSPKLSSLGEKILKIIFVQVCMMFSQVDMVDIVRWLVWVILSLTSLPWFPIISSPASLTASDYSQSGPTQGNTQNSTHNPLKHTI